MSVRRIEVRFRCGSVSKVDLSELVHRNGNILMMAPIEVGKVPEGCR
jgi:hypothetical protein